MFPEGDEQPVDLHPIIARQRLLKSRHRELRRFGLHVTPAVRDPVNVDVHPDLRLPAGDSEYQIRALRADTGQSRQDFKIARKLATKLAYRLLSDDKNLPRLRFMECAAVDQLVDLGDGQSAELLRR